MGVTQGDISEEILIPAVPLAFQEIGEGISCYLSNVRIPGNLAEYDIVCYGNEETIYITEVKTRVTQQHIKKFIRNRLPYAKEHLEKLTGFNYEPYKVYGAIAGRVVPDKARDLAQKEGLYVFKERHEGEAVCINSKDFAPAAYC